MQTNKEDDPIKLPVYTKPKQHTTNIHTLVIYTIITDATLQHGDLASKTAVSALLQQHVGQQQHPQNTIHPNLKLIIIF